MAWLPESKCFLPNRKDNSESSGLWPSRAWTAFARSLALLFQCFMFQWCQFSDPLTELGHPADPSFVGMCMLNCFSHVFRLFATLWTVGCQVPLFTGFTSKNMGVGCRVLLQRSSWLRDQTCISFISWIAGRFIITEPPWKSSGFYTILYYTILLYRY